MGNPTGAFARRQVGRPGVWSPRAAWAAVACTTALLALASILQLNALGVRGFAVRTLSTLTYPLIAAVVGALVIDSKGSHPVGWLFTMSGLTWALFHAGSAVALYPPDSAVPGRDLLIWCAAWTSIVGTGLVAALLVHVFPDGHATSARWRWAVILTIGIIALAGASYALAPGSLEDLPALDNPYGVTGELGQLVRAIRDVSWLLVLTCAAAGVVSLRQRARAAGVEQRQQIKWLLFAGAVEVAFGCFYAITGALVHPRYAAPAVGPALSLLPIALGIAILRHRLYDIDVLIKKTLVYGALSAVLAGVYVAGVFLLQRALAPVTADSNLAVAASTLTVAAMFRPLRARIQMFINRRFYRQQYNAAATVRDFSAHLRTEVDLEMLGGELVAVVSDTLQPRHTWLWLKAPKPQE